MNIVINKVDFWDGFECMKYWSYPKTYDAKRKKEEIKATVLSGQFIGARKVDGIWGMIIKDLDGNFHLRSRTKNVNGTYADKAEWIPWIVEDLKGIPNGTVLIGEIYKKGDEGSRKTTAVLNCLLSKSLERQIKGEPLHFYCFDIVAYDGKSLIDVPIEERIKYVKDKIEPVITPTHVEIATYKSGEDLWNLIGEVLNAGYEGVVIQNKVAKYTCGKRTAHLTVKIKKEIEQTIDAFLDGEYKLPTKEYTGLQPQDWSYWLNMKDNTKVNTNKYYEASRGEAWIPITKAYYYGWASAVSISVMRDGKPFHIGWISGIPDSMKEGIVNENEKWKNKVYEITAMEVEKIDGSYSLRHGKIVCERTDKRPEDCEFSQIEENVK